MMMMVMGFLMLRMQTGLLATKTLMEMAFRIQLTSMMTMMVSWMFMMMMTMAMGSRTKMSCEDNLSMSI